MMKKMLCFSNDLNLSPYLVSIAILLLFCFSCRNQNRNAGKHKRPPADFQGIEDLNSAPADDKSANVAHGQRIEVENVNLAGYKIETRDSDSFIRLLRSTGTARFNFALPSGIYDIDARYLSESPGQNHYALYIADTQIVAWLGKDRDDQWHKLSEQVWHAPRNVGISHGDEIRIETLSDNGTSAILDYIEFTESTSLSFSIHSSKVGTIRKSLKQEDPLLKSRSPGTDLVTCYPDEYQQAIKNPLKGFRPCTMHAAESVREVEKELNEKHHEYGSLRKTYFAWNHLERSVDDDVNRIIQVCNSTWKGIENKNIKVIPRVYLAWPGQKNNWPSDMTPGDFNSDEFRKRVIALIKKLGKAWDQDSRVAYVEMGLIGYWGEMEFPDTTEEIKEVIAARFNACFQNKHVMIRWPNTYQDQLYNFGYYWDSFAHHDQAYCGYHIENTSPRWKTMVIGGEVAYNWGHVEIQPGRNPEESLKNPVHRNYIMDTIRRLHANHLGWIADYNQNDEEVLAGAEILQKALGYRFVISEVSYPEHIESNTDFTVSFKVTNTGSSPFYYRWPVEVSLLDPAAKTVVWKQSCGNIDIRDWMPGDQWDDSADVYLIPPATYTAVQTLSLPDLPAGAYVLALSILDPAGNRPGVRFAIKNYYQGGRHPIGKVGVNCTIDSFTVSEFNDIQSDTTLSYDIVNAGSSL